MIKLKRLPMIIGKETVDKVITTIPTLYKTLGNMRPVEVGTLGALLLISSARFQAEQSLVKKHSLNAALALFIDMASTIYDDEDIDEALREFSMKDVPSERKVVEH